MYNECLILKWGIQLHVCGGQDLRICINHALLSYTPSYQFCTHPYELLRTEGGLEMRLSLCLWDHNYRQRLLVLAVRILHQRACSLQKYKNLELVTYVASTEIILRSRVFITMNVEWVTETSRMEEVDSMRRHSPMKPSTIGSTSSTSPFSLDSNGGNFTFRLPFTWTTCA